MRIISEKAMKKKIELGCSDLFELLRMLNSTNINENEILRNALFTALSVVEYPGELARYCYNDEILNAKEYYNNLGPVTEISGSIPQYYSFDMVLDHIMVERSRLKIKDTYVLLDFRTSESNGSYDKLIAKLLLCIENYVKSYAMFFDSFKLKLIEILIINICEQYNINYENDKDKEREILNKLMNILLEQIRQLEQTEDYQDLITPELVEQLKSEKSRHAHGRIVIDYVKKTYCQTPSKESKSPEKK